MRRRAGRETRARRGVCASWSPARVGARANAGEAPSIVRRPVCPVKTDAPALRVQSLRRFSCDAGDGTYRMRGFRTDARTEPVVPEILPDRPSVSDSALADWRERALALEREV